MRVHDRVESLLAGRQDFRDSDKKLLLAFWHTQGLELTEAQRQIFLERCTTAESITRARRLLKDKYPASEAVDKERFNKYVEYKNNHAVRWL